MVLYSYFDRAKGDFVEKYYYSGGADRIKQEFKKDTVSTMLGFKNRYKNPSGFKYGKNIEVVRDGKIVEIKQYACDFYGNQILVKRITNE